jgi:outer membrane protein assembly factor BamB
MGTSKGLLSIDPKGTKNWLYNSNRVLQTPLIGSDGTVYIITSGKISAVTYNGELKWEKQISTNFSSGSNDHHKVNLVILNTDLYYTSPETDGTTTKPYLIKINTINGDTLWSRSLTDYLNTNPASSPVISEDGIIFVGLNQTIFAFDSKGNLKWKKTFETDPKCQNISGDSVGNISINDKNVYFIVKGTHYQKGSWCNYCADTLYSLSQIGEIQWQENIHQNSGSMVIDPSGNLYLKTVSQQGIACYADYSLYSFESSGGIRFSKKIPYLKPKLVDSMGNIYGSYGNSQRELIALNGNGEEIWHSGGNNPPNNFIFFFALSKKGILYSSSPTILFGFGE